MLSGRSFVATFVIACVIAGAQPVMAIGPIDVPGFSFETPVIDPNVLPVGLTADHWTLTSTGFGNSGTFPNTNPGAAGFPDNAHGDGVGFDQLGYMFEITGNSFSQTLAAQFQAGEQYTLTVGVGVGGTFPAPNLDKFHLDLGYLTDPNNIATFVPVATSSITRNAGSDGLANNHLLDLPAITAGLIDDVDPIAIGKSIRIILRTEKFSAPEVGGQFIFDNVRLSSVPEPGSLVALGAAVAMLTRRRPVASLARC